MATRAKKLIVDEINKLRIRKQVSDTRALIQCPYHADNTPSGSIQIDESITVPLGWFRCFGCKESVPWNDLAAKLGMRQIEGSMARKTNADDYNSPADFKDELLGEDSGPDARFEEQMREFHYFEFQQPKWRGFQTSFLSKMGARLIYYDYDGKFYVWFPVLIKGKLSGYVRSTLTKSEGTSSHFNAPGSWSRNKGLLFYDQAVEMMRSLDLKTIVLCEGPRDALRLLLNGIPAMCVLGALNWTDEKRFVLEQSGADNLIIMMDGDLPDKKTGLIAGKEATKKIYNSCKTHFHTKYMALWNHAAKLGHKIDPGSCDKKFIKQVKEALT